MKLLFVKNKLTRYAQWEGIWYILTPPTEQETKIAIEHDRYFYKLGWRCYRVLAGHNTGGLEWIPDRVIEFSCNSDQIPLHISELDPVFREPVLKLI